jgi:hypothetical protein
MNTSAYRILALIYLAPVAIMHLIANTVATGFAADVSSFMFGATLFMIGFTALPWIGSAIGLDIVQTKPFEWIFNGALVVFCAISFVQMRGINVTSTDLTSIFALIWEWLSLGVGFIAFLAFWAVKGEAIKHGLADDHLNIPKVKR